LNSFSSEEATMLQRLGKLIVDFWIVLAFGVAAALLVPQAHAGLIATDEARAPEERSRVKALIVRRVLAKALSHMGMAPKDAAGRDDARADAEVLQLAGRLDAALAGGQMTNEQLLLLIIILLLLIIIL
jgi:hypothetical protein